MLCREARVTSFKSIHWCTNIHWLSNKVFLIIVNCLPTVVKLYEEAPLFASLLARMAECTKRSKAWLHFTKAKDKEKAKCHLCLTLVSRKGGNTTSTIKHLNVVHQIKEKCTTFDCLWVGSPTTAAVAGQSSSSIQGMYDEHTST